jgi:hypothetical protein
MRVHEVGGESIATATAFIARNWIVQNRRWYSVIARSRSTLRSIEVFRRKTQEFQYERLVVSYQGPSEALILERRAR